MILFSCRVKRLVGLTACFGFTLLASGCRNNEQTTTQITSNQTSASSPVSGVSFEEVAAQSGIKFKWPETKLPVDIYETVGYGCAFLDYDNDGWQDILLISAPSPALFRNLGNGRFEDVSERVGISKIQGKWNGCAVGDYDGDGFTDVLLNGYHTLALLKNERAQRWINVTAQAGLNPKNRNHMGSGAGFMDLDGNGTLDLVLLNYLKFGPKDKQHCEMVPGTLDACNPSEYAPEMPELWRNDGRGKFTDVSREAGFDTMHGKALTLAFSDINGDGRMDFYIGNDGVAADFLLNLGNLRFRNIGKSSGAAYGVIPGRPIAAMGADWSDFDRDGRLDLVVTGFSDEAASLLQYKNNVFENATENTELAGMTMNPLEFGAKWLDFDNDSWPDLALACGHVFYYAEQTTPLSPWRQPVLLAHNQPGDAAGQRRFVNLTLLQNESVTKPILGRGLATGDFDNDGRMDILVVDAEGAPLLLRNVSEQKHHWITLNLKGKSANRFAYGAKVIARAGQKTWVGQVSPASSYLASSDPRVHWGLGDTAVLDSITVKWLSGKETVLKDVQANQILTVQE